MHAIQPIRIGICCLAIGAAAYAFANDQAATLATSDQQPGGAATSNGGMDDQDAFSHPSGNLGFVQRFEFRIGNAIFRKLWEPSPTAPDKSSDGLGPLYNARSCQSCHIRDGRGRPHEASRSQDNSVSMVLKLSVAPQTRADRQALAIGKAKTIAAPIYGRQLQDIAIKGHKPEGRMTVTYQKRSFRFPDGEAVNLRAPTYRISELGYGPMDRAILLSPRVAPPMIGLGLLEAIPERDLLARADPDDNDGDGISGRPNKVWSAALSKHVIGRFGWKAASPTIADQVAEAFSIDMGLSTKLAPAPYGECTPTQSICRTAPDGAGQDETEVTDQLSDLTVFYSQNIAVPPRRNADDPDVRFGQRLFSEVGCAACHTASHNTGPMPNSPNLAGQTIWPYTDLLLHDMGPGLADNRPEGRADGREWRTPPLWGIGLTKLVSGHTNLLHDGRARNVTEAILWHGGEARRARDNFARLSKKERAQLVKFVNSL